MKRLFVAIPVQGIDFTLAQERLRSCDADINFVSQLHFTLKFLGNVEEEKISLILKQLREISTKFKPFTLTLQGVGAFPSSGRINAIWIGTENENLLALYQKVNAVLEYVRKEEYEEIIPHLTIGS